MLIPSKNGRRTGGQSRDGRVSAWAVVIKMGLSRYYEWELSRSSRCSAIPPAEEEFEI